MAFAVRPNRGIKADINVTPLVDVVLVLLIIFMVATPILQMGLDVEVPPKVEVATPPPESEQNQLVITVKKDGLYLNTAKMATIPALRDELARQMVSRPPDQRIVFINSEDNLAFDSAVAAMDAAHQAGAAKVGFLTDPPPKE
ncbi:MAG: biopolymer transport protein ExbD [Acidobacteriota bacterium]|nr:biopolymer transport protein ExbD [Acidobacteriota bacterium]